MDMSFANQALAAEYLYKHADELENKVYDVPAAIDDDVARVKLETLGIEIDTLTEEQIAYMNSWNFRRETDRASRGRSCAGRPFS